MSSWEDEGPNQPEYRLIWEKIHQERPSSQHPDMGLVAFAEQLQQHVPANAPVLDFGCGQGRHSRYLAQLGFNVLGCDWSLNALQTGRSLFEPGSHTLFVTADLTWLPFPDDYFAAAVAVHVLAYLVSADLMAGIRELRRVLAPGGRFYLDLLDVKDPEYGCGSLVEPNTYLDEDGVPVHFSSEEEIAVLLDGCKVQQQSLIKIGRRFVWEIWGSVF